MRKKEFIFTPGIWLGEGKITLAVSPESLRFYTKWEIKESVAGILTAIQVVEIEGMDERMFNSFTFKNILPDSFNLVLENDLVGFVAGQGVRGKRAIAWEFHNQSNFKGFETYEQQENGDYFLHAEYGESDQYQTTIEGVVWHKGS